MVAAMGVPFGVYRLEAALFAPVVGIPVVLAGSVPFVGIQYVVGKKHALERGSAGPLPENGHSEVHRRVEMLAEDMGIDKLRLQAGQMGLPSGRLVSIFAMQPPTETRIERLAEMAN